MQFTPGGHPAQRLLLRGATFLERGLGQRFFHLRQLDLPLRCNAVHDHVLEHGKPLVGVAANNDTDTESAIVGGRHPGAGPLGHGQPLGD